MIKAVIFDLGNVLIDFDHTIAAKKIIQYCDKTLPEIYQFFFDSPLTAQFEEGKISADSFYREVKKALNLKLSKKEFLPVWNEIFFQTENNRYVYKFAAALKPRYKICLLSNINILHYEYLKKEYPIFDIFDHIILSFKEKSKKPDEKIYQGALKRLRLSPNEVFYADDREDLIESSRKLGIQAFVYKNPEKLKNDLLSAGIMFS